MCFYFSLYNYEEKVATVMVNNSITSINKLNNRFLPQIIQHKKRPQNNTGNQRPGLGQAELIL